MLGRMPTYIELRLTTGERRHVATGESNARAEIDRWAQRDKTSWIETVEGIWVNPDHIVAARLVELPGAPTGSED
jgi:kynureninase